jgi:hypothetical protein
MKITPTLRSCQFAKLDSGELFIVHHRTGSYLAIAVSDPKAAKDPNAKDKMVLLLGPASPDYPKVPVLTNFSQQTPVISFAKDYKLRLPCDTIGWLATEPDEGQCIVLAEDKVYLRAQFAGTDKQVYIDLKAGLLLKDAYERSAYPSGDCAYTSGWTFLTTEGDAREILSSASQPTVSIRPMGG